MEYEFFAVDPQAVRGLAAALDEQADAAGAARGYVGRWGGFSTHDSGLIGHFHSPHDTYLHTLVQRMSHLEDLLRTSAAELRSSADYYRRTDTASAARFDALLPGVTAATIDVG